MNIANRIQHLRKVKGISQEELADEVGVSRQAVSKWESEQSMPDVGKITLLSNYFEVTTDYIIKGTKPNAENSDKATTDIANKLTRFIEFLKITVNKHRKVCITIGAVILIIAMGETILELLDRGENVLYEFGQNLHNLFCPHCS